MPVPWFCKDRAVHSPAKFSHRTQISQNVKLLAYILFLMKVINKKYASIHPNTHLWSINLNLSIIVSFKFSFYHIPKGMYVYIQPVHTISTHHSTPLLQLLAPKFLTVHCTMTQCSIPRIYCELLNICLRAWFEFLKVKANLKLLKSFLASEIPKQRKYEHWMPETSR